MLHDLDDLIGIEISRLPSASDEALMRAFVEKGDRDSFEKLMRRYQHELYNYLRRYLGDDELAEDAFQLTFVRVYQRAHQFDLNRRLRPWLYQVATRQAIDLKRRDKHRHAFSIDSTAQSASECQTSPASLIADYRSTDMESVELSELREQLHVALKLVGEPGKSALELIYLQGMAYNDAAEKLDVPVGTVKSRVHAAVRKLAGVWQRIGNEKAS